MKAILIDPFKKEVSEVNIDMSSLESIYDAINAQNFEVAYLKEKSDCVYVDGEGLVTDNQKTSGGGLACFLLPGYGHPLAGRGLLGGYSHSGQSVDCHSKLEEIKNSVTFLKLYPRETN